MDSVLLRTAFLRACRQKLFYVRQNPYPYTGGKHTVARVTSVAAEKGLTIVQGAVRASDDGPEFEFESRYAGMNVARELERFMDEQHSRFLPALIVGQNDHPRAMFLIKTRAGHLDNDYINSLKTDRK